MAGIALALAAHVAFICIFGTKKYPALRAVINVPHLQLADAASELIALDDPTIFVLPHANDFATAFWQSPPVVKPPSFSWPAPPHWLLPDGSHLAAIFSAFMETNSPGKFGLNFKPPPPFTEIDVPVISPTPPDLTPQISGDLAQRRWLNPIMLPPLTNNDVIVASRIQVLVDVAGTVVSTVILPAENSAEALGRWEPADQRAQTLARAARFAPAPQLTFGEMIFNWHTVPAAPTNSIAPP